MKNICIIVEDGMVQTVYSTSKDIDVEVIDLDTTDWKEEEELRQRVDQIENMKSYKHIY